MQRNRSTGPKRRAFTPEYVSPRQLTLEGFETPFEQQLLENNRWVKLAKAIPWDGIVSRYDKIFKSEEGRKPISGRVVVGAIIIKHLNNLSDRETIEQIRENMYMQYFLGYSSYTCEAPFAPSLFVEIRERLNFEFLSEINELIAVNYIQEEASKLEDGNRPQSKDGEGNNGVEDELAKSVQDIKDANDQVPTETVKGNSEVAIENKGKLLVDATVAPQNIAFPTDLNILNDARKKSEQLIDLLYTATLHGKPKPRTYRRNARRDYLNTAKKKNKSHKTIRKANGQQLRYLKRNLRIIDVLLKSYRGFPLRPPHRKYFEVIKEVYAQQQEMHRNHIHTISNRIVSIHQPHVRPIVRGKVKAKTEFGSKIEVSLVAGFMFIDYLSWDAFNEGTYLIDSVEKYKKRFGHYPADVLADQIYCNRENRRALKALHIKLVAKPLGRPSAQAVKNHVRPGERNPIEGKFGQGKVKYGLDNIRARLRTTSESWIASIALVLNLVALTRHAPLRILERFLSHMLLSPVLVLRKKFTAYGLGSGPNFILSY